MEELRKQIGQALEEGKIAGFLGLKLDGGGISPFFVTRDNLPELERLTCEGRLSISKVLTRLTRQHPDRAIGILARGCDERAIIELLKASQIPDTIVQFGVACTPQMAESCQCPQPYPSRPLSGEKTQGVNDSVLLGKLEEMSADNRLDYWMQQFSKCIKCYGCRDICPVCYCQECTLEDPNLVPRGMLPPVAPAFHFIKAMHMADRCIDCGLCEETCPAAIPLRTIYRRMRKVMQNLFDYVPGRASDERSPLGALDLGGKLVH